MINDIVKGILSEHQGKSLTKKRVNELTARIVSAVQMIRATEPVETPKNKDTGVNSVETDKGNKAIVSQPEKPKKQKGNSAIVAFPIGAQGQGVMDGKRVNDDVGVFKVKSE